MEPKRRERLLVIAALACLVLLLGDRLVLSPLAALWTRQGVRIEQSRQSLEKGTLLIERQAELEERWTRMRQDGLPPDRAEAENRVLRAVGEWSAASRFETDALKPRWIADAGAGDRFEIRLSGKGNIASVARFLYELETAAVPARLESFEIRARDERGQELTLDARLTGLVPEGKI